MKKLLCLFLAIFVHCHADETIVHCQTLNYGLDRAKAPGLYDRKRVYIANIDPLTIVQPRELSRDLNRNLKLDSVLEPGNPFNIANDYFEMEQYPWAVLYYARALKENPQNTLAQDYLNLALEKLPGPKTPPSIETPGHMFLWFLIFLMLSLVVGSLAFWMKKKSLIVIFGGTSLIVLGLIAYATMIQYFTPIPAIMVESSPLFRGKGESFGLVGNIPVFAGSSIDVIEVSEKGTWLKVTTKEGAIGYLPLKSLRII